MIAQRHVGFIAAQGQTVLIQPVAMREFDDIAKTHGGTADKVGCAAAEAGTFGQERVLVGQAIALAERGRHAQAGALEAPVKAIGKSHAVFDPVIPRKAVERKQVGVFQIDRARILVRNLEIAHAGGGDDLKTRGQHLRAAKQAADKRPLYIKCSGGDAARLPAR